MTDNNHWQPNGCLFCRRINAFDKPKTLQLYYDKGDIEMIVKSTKDCAESLGGTLLLIKRSVFVGLKKKRLNEIYGDTEQQRWDCGDHGRPKGRAAVDREQREQRVTIL